MTTGKKYDKLIVESKKEFFGLGVQAMEEKVTRAEKNAERMGAYKELGVKFSAKVRGRKGLERESWEYVPQSEGGANCVQCNGFVPGIVVPGCRVMCPTCRFPYAGGTCED